MAKTNNTLLTERDKAILLLMSEFGGKTYSEVLERTFWYGKAVPLQQSRDRMSVLKNKYKVIKLLKTGLMKPQNGWAFSEFGRRFVNEELGLDVGVVFSSPVTTWHNIFEQITYYWLKKAGKDVSRTVVKDWSVSHKHTPDLLYFHNGDTSKPIYVEIELNAKAPSRYTDLFTKSTADGVFSFLYVFESVQAMKTIGKKLPTFSRLYFVDIDTLIKSVASGKGLGAVKQSDFLKTLG